MALNFSAMARQAAAEDDVIANGRTRQEEQARPQGSYLETVMEVGTANARMTADLKGRFGNGDPGVYEDPENGRRLAESMRGVDAAGARVVEAMNAGMTDKEGADGMLRKLGLDPETFKPSPQELAMAKYNRENGNFMQAVADVKASGTKPGETFGASVEKRKDELEYGSLATESLAAARAKVAALEQERNDEWAEHMGRPEVLADIQADQKEAAAKEELAKGRVAYAAQMGAGRSGVSASRESVEAAAAEFGSGALSERAAQAKGREYAAEQSRLQAENAMLARSPLNKDLVDLAPEAKAARTAREDAMAAARRVGSYDGMEESQSAINQWQAAEDRHMKVLMKAVVYEEKGATPDAVNRFKENGNVAQVHWEGMKQGLQEAMGSKQPNQFQQKLLDMHASAAAEIESANTVPKPDKVVQGPDMVVPRPDVVEPRQAVPVERITGAGAEHGTSPAGMPLPSPVLAGYGTAQSEGPDKGMGD